jgi:drug/metabolite transporter (DMT)-like permease
VTPAVTASETGRGWLLPYLGAALIWGCSFLFIKLGLEALSPIHVAFGRQALGALALLALAAVARVRLPRDRATWMHLFVVAILFNSVPSTLFAFGETHVSSVVAGIINAVTPLATIGAAFVAFPSERPTAGKVVGILVGLAGILVVVGIWNGVGSSEALGVLACLGAIACYGIGFPYIRRYLAPRGERPLALAAGQIGVAAVQLLPFALLDRSPIGALTPQVVGGMLALGTLGTGIAYVWNFQVIDRAGATTASTVTYLTPLVAIAVGALLLAEPVTPNEPLGGLVVLLGVAVAQGRLVLPSRSARRRGSGR